MKRREGGRKREDGWTQNERRRRRHLPTVAHPFVGTLPTMKSRCTGRAREKEIKSPGRLLLSSATLWWEVFFFLPPPSPPPAELTTAAAAAAWSASE